VEFSIGVIGTSEGNRAPHFDSDPLTSATVGSLYQYDVNASDPELQGIAYRLLTAPQGMTIDAVTGLVRWTPVVGALVKTPVVLQAFDSRGALTLQRFVIDVAGGNRAPELVGVPTQIEGVEGDTIAFEIQALDADLDALSLWADNLPPGAQFDSATRLFSWTPDYTNAGTYNDVQFHVSDGISQTSASLTILVAEGHPPPTLEQPADRTVREGERIRFRLDAAGGDGGDYLYYSSMLPPGATLNSTTGVFEWTPSFTRHGEYQIGFGVATDTGRAQVVTKFTVLNANGAPQLDPQSAGRCTRARPSASRRLPSTRTTLASSRSTGARAAI